MVRILTDIITRIERKDSAHRDWCVNEHKVTEWVNATSSLAIGVIVESGGYLVEDACWLRPVHENKHIDSAELDAMLRGVMLVWQWKATVVHLKTDSACVHPWVFDTVSRNTRVRTKASSEMLIRCRLSTLRELAAKYWLTIDVGLVRFHENQANILTKMSQR